MNTFENIMENGAFAPLEQMLNFHNIFKYVVFQRRQKALSWSKGLNMMLHVFVKVAIMSKSLSTFPTNTHFFSSMFTEMHILFGFKPLLYRLFLDHVIISIFR